MSVKFETQQSLIAALKANSAFMAAVSDRVYDTPPDNLVYPYVCIEASNSTPDNRHGKKGYRILITFGIYTRPGLLGSYQRENIQGLMDDVLNLQPLTVSSGNYTIGGCMWFSSNDFKNQDILGCNTTYKLFVYAESIEALTLTGCVMAFNLKKVYNTYTGNVLTLRRSVDNDEMDIPFYGTYIDYQLAEAFCGASDGYVTTWYNQYPGGLNATQTDTTKQPKLVTAGVFDAEGLTFDGTNDFFEVVKYSAIDILAKPLTIYVSSTPDATQNGIVVALNNSAYTDAQYAISLSAIQVYLYMQNTIRIQSGITAGLHQMFIWGATGTLKFKTDTGTATGTAYTGALTSRNTFNIGAWMSPTQTLFFKGKIKGLLIFNTDEEAQYNKLSSY